MIRTVEQWKEILNSKATETEMAKRILADIVHYFPNRTYEKDDYQQLANALEAFHKIRSE